MKKIVVIGPESTGKSTLCQQLSEHFETVWCPEYARQYLLEHGTSYSFNELLVIAKGQLELEQHYIDRVKAIAGAQYLFVDTDQYVMKVWCEFVFGDCHNWILRQIVGQEPDLYLLCKPDLPWVKDELREYPNELPRQQLYHMYRDILINQSIPWVEISGDYQNRFQNAVQSIQNKF